MTTEATLLHKLANAGLAALPEDPGRVHFKVPEDVEPPSELRHIVDDIREQIAGCGLPNDIAENPMFKFAVLQHMDEVGAMEIKNVIPFVPRMMDRQWLNSKILEIATRFVESTGMGEPSAAKAIAATRNALLWNLGESLKLMDKTPIIRKDIVHPEKEGLLSTANVRQALMNVKQKVEGDASLDPDIVLLTELEILNGDEDMEKVKTDLRTCVRKAWKFYEKLGASLAKAQAEFEIGGEQVKVDPSFLTKAKGMYELLMQAMEEDDNSENKTGINLLRYHEAQTIAYLAFLFFMVLNHPTNKASKQLQEKYRLEVGTALFGQDENLILAKAYINSKRNIIDEPVEIKGDEIYTQYSIRNIMIEGGERAYRVWFEDMRTKLDESIIKRLINSPSFDYEDIPDIIAGRLVLWDIDRADLITSDEDNPGMENEKNQRMEDLEKIARIIGKSLGLTHAYVDREKLMHGQFCIKNKLIENGENEMYAYKLYGLNKDGVRIEFQIITRDVFREINSWESPRNHDMYDLKEKVFPATLSVFRQSSSPRIHEVVREAKMKLLKRKNRRRGLINGKSR